MSAKTVLYLSILVAGILLLALGGFVVKGARRLAASLPAGPPTLSLTAAEGRSQ